MDRRFFLKGRQEGGREIMVISRALWDGGGQSSFGKFGKRSVDVSCGERGKGGFNK